MTTTPGPRPAGAAALLAEVLEQGYAIVPLLSAAEVARLAQDYRRLTDESGFGCRPSTISPDAAYRVAARDLVRSVLEPRVQAVLPDYRCVVAAFVPKEPSPASEMVMHQDWSTCDESQHVPLEVWVPLTAAAVEDGALQVVPGSHRGAAKQRGSGMPLVLPDDAAPSAVEPTADAIALDVAPGDAVVFHPALVHGSGPNRGDDLRLAVISTFQPRAADLVHYLRRDDGAVVTYRVEEDFYVSNFRPGDEEPGRVIAVADA